MSRPFLIVEGGGALFAVDQGLVREIVPARAMTRLPGAPPAVRGLLNVRGTLVTVIDLATRFGQGGALVADPSVVIAVTEARTIGLLVDDVHDVLSFAEEELLPATEGSSDPAVVGLGHFGDRVVLAVELQELARQTFA
ncbi:MAG: purine-binding chemotaxis protein CheW [Gemmatimonadetes bacterium]|nr:purine-binding chemotaxis protein CheW [Gemmatimonadota bacterium]MCC6771800.1 purine-binding chemotaxis protein CheW [Gemmatimonadaceae bacterium]